MHDLDTVTLRRQAAELAERSRRQWRTALWAIHGFLYLAAVLVMAFILVVMPWVFDALWNTIDLSLVVAGLFAGWGVGLALHGASVLLESRWMDRQFRQRAAAAALGRALLEEEEAEQLDAKAKRGAATLADYALDDDGELVAAGEAARDERRSVGSS